MLYFKSNGVVTQPYGYVVDSLLEESGASSFEGAVEKLFVPSVHIGRENLAQLEIHIRDDKDAIPAAVGYVTLGGYYETYLIDTRHAALLFVKEFSATIRNVCDLTTPEEER